MDKRKIIDDLKKAVKNKLTVKINMKHGLGDSLEIDIDPYIVGSDMMQYDFVWGFVSHNQTFYKLTLDFIQAIQLTDNHFDIVPRTNYLYAIEEEHSEIVDGINVYGTTNEPD